MRCPEEKVSVETLTLVVVGEVGVYWLQKMGQLMLQKERGWPRQGHGGG